VFDKAETQIFDGIGSWWDEIASKTAKIEWLSGKAAFWLVTVKSVVLMHRVSNHQPRVRHVSM
jgi:hypothetical protein